MFTLGLAQTSHPADGDVVADVRRWARAAREAGVDLLVFPEALMTRFEGSVERFKEQAQPLDGPFAHAIDAIAADEGLWIVYTMNEASDAAATEDHEQPRESEDSKDRMRFGVCDDAEGADEIGCSEGSDSLPYNTAVVTDSSGRQRASYRKVHLFDAQGFCESDRMAAGDRPFAPVETPFCTLGLAICYDLRFPEMARMSALSGAGLMLYPAAWVEGPGKVDQWETLLRARAIENGMFVAGLSSVDEGRIGQSRVYAPDGTLLAHGGNGEELVTCEIDLQALQRVREATPSLRHRRPDCYGDYGGCMGDGKLGRFSGG